MTYTIVPRTEAGLPAVVTSSSGKPRAPLHNEPWITAHYTGNNIDYTGRDAAEVTRQIQAVFSTTKPFEYNYVIGQNVDSLIIEFAGKFQAAHSGGENADSFGVLFLLGVGEQITDLMIDKWRWLRDVLIADGSLRADVAQRQHKQMPGAATQCPGDSIVDNWGRLLLPWEPPYIAPPPTEPTERSDMPQYFARPPESLAADDTPWFYVECAAVRYATTADFDPDYNGGVTIPVYQFPDTPEGRNQYRFLKANAFPLPVPELET